PADPGRRLRGASPEGARRLAPEIGRATGVARAQRARIRRVGSRIPTVVRAMKRVTGSGTVGGRRRLEGNALRRYRLLLLLPIFALVLQACGTRLPNSAFVNANKGGSSNAQGISEGDQTGADQSGTGASTGQEGTAGSTT